MGKRKNYAKEPKEKALTYRQELYMIAELEAKLLAEVCCGGVESEDSDEENYQYIYKTVDVPNKMQIE